MFQLLVLCRVFEEDQNPSLSTRALLADKLEAPLERITIWFQNQRARGFPAKKLLKESNLGKDSMDLDLSDVSTKKDQGMRKSSTPLSNGNGSSSHTLPIDYSKLSTTVSSSPNETKTACLSALLGTPTVSNPSVSIAPSTSFAHLPPLPLQLLNMTQPVKSDQASLPSSITNGQTFAQFPGFTPHIYTPAQSNVARNNASNNGALNYLGLYPPVSVKQEPIDLVSDLTPVSTSLELPM